MASNGASPASATKNQPRQVRRPTGAECRILRLRRATGSDEENLVARSRGGQAPRRQTAAICGQICNECESFRPKPLSKRGNVRSWAYALGRDGRGFWPWRLACERPTFLRAEAGAGCARRPGGAFTCDRRTSGRGGGNRRRQEPRL